MGAPPKSRTGDGATSGGRTVLAGVGPHLRSLSSRTSHFELWSPLRTLTTDDIGLDFLRKQWSTSMSPPEFGRFRAFVGQAEAYYHAALQMAPESRPLVAYYFALNLACLASILSPHG